MEDKFSSGPPAAADEVGHSGGQKLTWAQSIANEKLSIFAEQTRVPRAHWKALGTPESSLLFAKIASKVWVGSMGMGERSDGADHWAAACWSSPELTYRRRPLPAAS